MMTCEEALAKVYQYLDKELSPEDLPDFERHLQICRDCYDRVEFERKLKERIGGCCDEKVPPRMRDRIRRLIDQF